MNSGLDVLYQSQQMTGRPIRFEVTEQTREAVQEWNSLQSVDVSGYLFPSRIHRRPHLSTRQYARIVNQWVSSIGLDPHKNGTHSMRRTKASLIYKKTGNLHAVQLLLGHTKLESTVRYLSIEVDDVLRISERVVTNGNRWQHASVLPHPNAG